MRPTEPFRRAAILRTRRNVIAIGSLLGGATLTALLPASSAKAQPSTTPGQCFVRGTRIRTPDGQRKIEDLKIGDLVLTKSGEAKPVRWVARRRYRKAPGTKWVEYVAPIRVARSALADNVPACDLYVSEEHALHFDGILIPVIELLNGTTIARFVPDEFDEIEYLHIKLTTHDVLYAEGLECESLGTGSYEHFDNFIEYERLYGRQEDALTTPYAPINRFDGGRSKLKSRIRSAVSPLIDRRTKFDRIRDALEDRAELLVI
jgi:Hint domain